MMAGVMRSRRRGLLLFASIASLAIACGEVSGDPPAHTDPEADAARFASAACDWPARCVPLQFRHLSGDASHCQAQVLAEVRATLTDPHVKLPPGWLDACIQALETRACDPTTSVPECQPPRGDVAEGGACYAEFDCAPGLSCTRVATPAYPLGAPCGTCAPPSGPCASCGADEVCGPGGECTPRIPVGAACTFQGCVAGAICAGPIDAAVCTVNAYLGGPCDPTHPACEDWTHCNEATRTCVESTMADVGAACGDPGVGCVSGAICDLYGSHLCVANAKIGEHCDDHAGPLCDGFAVACAANVCTATDPTACE